ncbi:hypothetical protein OIU77_025011 [Salix suchowensis]|uniref:Uncharacterized protein n=1 Tax=Salix suchowensis TaxID=1278906 RepID=A0ABQ9BYT0_9ROSI|nr:hypothetical protein OIU78_011744 [Salix suchowensis]KAJ6390919.1 hypothetical protein OIU77_025011 [Salix suchowensis]
MRKTDLRHLKLTKIVAEIEGLGGSPRGIVIGSGVGGGIEEPAGIVANGVVDIFSGRSLGRGGGDQDSSDG